MKPWKTISKDAILNTNKFLKIEKHAVQLPDGKVIPDWQYVITPDFVSIVALTKKGEFVVIKQYKYAVGEVTISPVGGYIEPGEEPLESAKRELREEAGYESENWISLGKYVIDSNRGCGNAYLFLAKDAEQTCIPNSGDLEEQEILLLSRTEIDEIISEEKLKVIPWIANFLLALRKI